MQLSRRNMIGASLGMGLLGARSNFAQQPPAEGAGGHPQPAMARPPTPPVPTRAGKITKLFKTPEGHPNALSVAPEGWWVGEQLSDNACLLDSSGKLLKTVKTDSKNTSGMACGGGCIWMGANAEPNGIFQIDLKSGAVIRHEIPLGGGGAHGLEYVDGKLWIAAQRIRGILKVDTKTWEPEFLIPYSAPRAHGIAWNDGALWMVFGDDEGSGLVKYQVTSGRILETVRFAEKYPDPHGLAVRDGALYTCDAGLHPGWQREESTASGYVCRIDLV
jgi:hypothetical protein